MRIAVIEDDRLQADVLHGWITESGHDCFTYEDARSFMREFAPRSFDLVVLDWELPDYSGIEVLHWVRHESTWRVPILFVTNRDTAGDIVHALEEGADDYIAKPPTRAVTLARIKALARRADSGLQDRTVWEMGNYRIDRARSMVFRDGEAVELTDKEFKLAVMLFRNVGRLLSRDYLLQSIWGIPGAIPTRTVDTHVSRLRQKLGLVPENGWRLKAAYHHGYRLERVEDVEEEERAEA